MMAMRQKMMADDKAADARLQPLIDKMNAAKGEAKVDAMAAAITELIRQRTGTREHMTTKVPSRYRSTHSTNRDGRLSVTIITRKTRSS